jgi:type II secretory pathway pseudopilin PulG
MKNTKASKSAKDGGFRKELIIAIIGLVGTIAAALITTWGSLTKENKALEFTQTAQVAQALAILNATSTVQPTETPDRSWEQAFNVDLSQSLCRFTAEIVPEWFVPYLGTAEAFDKWQTRDSEPWPYGPGPAKPVSYYVDIANISNNTVWPRIANTFHFTVSWIEDAPEHANVLLNGGGCGGGDFYTSETDVSLSPDFVSAKQNVLFNDYDYYTLEPGESGIFFLDVYCKGPGVYALDMDIPYSFDSDWKTVNWKASRTIVCPNTFTSWTVNPNGSILFYKNFSWDAQALAYVEAP